jgi:hypothetical protein
MYMPKAVGCRAAILLSSILVATRYSLLVVDSSGAGQLPLVVEFK